jgi:hypothetical protein
VSIATRWIFIAVLVSGLTYRSAALRAQATDVAVTAGPASATWNHGISIETRQAAREAFLEGNRLFRAPLFVRAIEQYRAALARWQHPAFYFNMGLAQLNLGQYLEAHETLELAIRSGPEPLGDDRFQEARKQLQDIERRLGRLRIQCSTSGAEVTLDGAPLFTGPGSWEGWVYAKTHEITAKKPDYLSEARLVKAPAGQLERIDLKLVTLEEAGDAGRRWAKWKPWTVVAAGAAFAAAGGAVHAVAARNFKSFDDAFLEKPCASTGCTEDEIGPALNARLNRATRQQQIAVGCYIAGGSLVAAGMALLYMNRPRLLEQQASSSAGHVTIAPTVSDGAIGILVNVTR